MTSEVRVCADIGAVAVRAGEAAARILSSAARARGRCSLVLAGGSTPRALYRFLAMQSDSELPWSRVHVFWGDERYVPPSDPRSNYRMAKEALLDHVPCPSANVHPMPTHFASPEVAAQHYEETLRTFFPSGRTTFDLVLLGLGSDGHTASLFPGSAALMETTRWVRAISAPADPPTRLTLTWPALTTASNIHVLVSGAAKAQALRHVVDEGADEELYPAARLYKAEGSVTWWVDTEAAGGRTP